MKINLFLVVKPDSGAFGGCLSTLSSQDDQQINCSQDEEEAPLSQMSDVPALSRTVHENVDII